jgi:Tfp pilus assembly protein PilW
MITMVIALVLLAGMSSLFVSQTRTAQMLSQKSEVMNDLFLASQIMQFELRGAKAICWDPANKSIRYQPLTSDRDLDSACAKATGSPVEKKKNGFFRSNAKGSKPSPFISWKKVGNVNALELIRGMKSASQGIVISPTGNTAPNALQAVRTITLTAQYLDRDHQTKDLSLSFKVWPRNTQ